VIELKQILNNYYLLGRVLLRRLEDKIKSIVANTLGLSYEDVTFNTGPSNIESWDSLGQLTLVSNIEKEFGILLEFSEIFEIVSVKTLIDVVNNKLNERKK
jgi:acyl carrier protein